MTKAEWFKNFTMNFWDALREAINTTIDGILEDQGEKWLNGYAGEKLDEIQRYFIVDFTEDELCEMLTSEVIYDMVTACDITRDEAIEIIDLYASECYDLVFKAIVDWIGLEQLNDYYYSYSC